jgi:hypothetical protein
MPAPSTGPLHTPRRQRGIWRWRCCCCRWRECSAQWAAACERALLQRVGATAAPGLAAGEGLQITGRTHCSGNHDCSIVLCGLL